MIPVAGVGNVEDAWFDGGKAAKLAVTVLSLSLLVSLLFLVPTGAGFETRRSVLVEGIVTAQNSDGGFPLSMG